MLFPVGCPSPFVNRSSSEIGEWMPFSGNPVACTEGQTGGGFCDIVGSEICPKHKNGVIFHVISRKTCVCY